METCQILILSEHFRFRLARAPDVAQESWIKTRPQAISVELNRATSEPERRAPHNVPIKAAIGRKKINLPGGAAYWPQ